MKTTTIMVGLVSTSLNNRYLLDNIERHVNFADSSEFVALRRPMNREARTMLVSPSGDLQRRLSDATRQAIVWEYCEGASSRTLHARYGIAKGSVIKIVREAGVEPRPPHSRKTNPMR